MRKEIFKLKRIWLIALLPLSFILILFAKSNPYITERLFARGIYKYASLFINKLSSVFSFSIIEFVFIGVPILLILSLTLFIYHLVHNKTNRIRTLYVSILNFVVAISVLTFTFTFLCGLNYYRYDFSHYLDFHTDEYTVDDLYSTCMELAHKANEVRGRVSSVDDGGVFQLANWNEASSVAPRTFHALAKQYPVFENTYGNPKPILLSKYLSYTQIVGIFIPFTMEANINTDVPDYTIPFNMCHELAHMYGFMKEDEANYIAYLACVNSGNMDFKYSGLMLALSYSLWDLHQEDVDKYYEIIKTFDESILLDLFSENRYWDGIEDTYYQNTISEVSNTMNDAYLKSNGQAEGVKSYEKMVKLLIAEHLHYADESH